MSVVIPTYNRPHYLPAAVDSVLAQTFTDFEVIVVDDGSPCDVSAVLANIADPRVRIVRQPNRGLAAALNTGVALSRGRFWARLDDDDLWMPEMLAATVHALEERPDVAMVYAKSRAITASGQLRPEIFGSRGEVPDDPLASILAYCCIGHHTTLTRRECFARTGLFDEALPSCEDWDMWLRVARAFNIAFIDRVLTLYRLHPNSMTSPSGAGYGRHLDGHLAVLEKFFADDSLRPSERGLQPRALRNVHTEICLRAWASGNHARARQALVAAMNSGANPWIAAMRLAWFALDLFALRSIPGLARLRPTLTSARQRLRDRRFAAHVGRS